MESHKPEDERPEGPQGPAQPEEEGLGQPQQQKERQLRWFRRRKSEPPEPKPSKPSPPTPKSTRPRPAEQGPTRRRPAQQAPPGRRPAQQAPPGRRPAQQAPPGRRTAEQRPAEPQLKRYQVLFRRQPKPAPKERPPVEPQAVRPRPEGPKATEPQAEVPVAEEARTKERRPKERRPKERRPGEPKGAVPELVVTEPPQRRPLVININLLPMEYQPRKIPTINIVLVAIVAVGIGMVALLFFLRLNTMAGMGVLQTELLQLQLEEAMWSAKAPQAIQLTQQIDAVNEEVEAINNDYETYVSSLIPWSGTIDDLDEAVPGKRITLLELEEDIDDGQSELTIAGTATKRAYIYDYAQSLEDTGRFQIPVTIKSMEDTGSEIEFEIVAIVSPGGEQ